MSSSQKGFAPILIILVLVALLGAAAYFFKDKLTTNNSPESKVDTANEADESQAHDTWQVYTNKKYKFEIQYPESWKVGKEAPGFANYDSSFADDDEVVFYEDPKAQLMNITVTSKEAGSTLESNFKVFLDEMKQYPDLAQPYVVSNKVDLPSVKHLVTNGYSGAGTPGPQMDIDTGTHYINVYTELEEDLAYKIFSTFKLTK